MQGLNLRPHPCEGCNHTSHLFSCVHVKGRESLDFQRFAWSCLLIRSHASTYLAVAYVLPSMGEADERHDRIAVVKKCEAQRRQSAIRDRDGKIAGLFVRVSRDAKTYVLKYRFEVGPCG